MSPATTVDSPKPVSIASSHKTNDDDKTHDKKHDKKPVPDEGKRPLAEMAANVSTPEGGARWPAADDGGVGKTLDETASGENAPVPPPAPTPEAPVDEMPPPKKGSRPPPTTNGTGDTLAMPYWNPYLPKPDPRGISGSQLDNHLQNSKKEASALKTLTTDGNFEKVAGDDGSLSLQEAQQYLKNHPLLPDYFQTESSLASDQRMNEALKTITTNGDFERLAGGPNKQLTLPQLQQALVDQEQQTAHLETVQKDFKTFAGADERLSRNEVQDAAAQAQDPAMKSALDWLDQNYDGTAAKSYYNDPEQTGQPYDGSVNPDIQQQREGNCVRLAVFYGLAQTPAGKAMLENMVDKQPDGSFHVTFPGDKSQKIYQVKPEELNGRWADGDPGGQVVATAIEKYGADHPDVNLGSVADVMDVFTGRGRAPENRFNGRPPAEVTNYFTEQADAVNSGQEVMIMGGKALPHGEGDFAVPADHAYTVTNIDVANNRVTYVNPWDTTVKHSIPLDKLSNDVVQDSSESVFSTVPVY